MVHKSHKSESSAGISGVRTFLAILRSAFPWPLIALASAPVAVIIVLVIELVIAYWELAVPVLVTILMGFVWARNQVKREERLIDQAVVKVEERIGKERERQ